MQQLYSLKRGNKKAIDYISNRLKSYNQKFELKDSKFNTYFYIENQSIERGKLISIAIDCVLYIYKTQYFINNILESEEQEYSKVIFIGALATYENRRARVLLTRILNKFNAYSLDTIFNCAMREQRVEWDELIKLAKDVIIEGKVEDFYEVARYMLRYRQRSAVYVFGKNYTITDMINGSEMEVIELYDNKEFNLIYTLIAYGITTVYIGEMENNLILAMREIFELKDISK